MNCKTVERDIALPQSFAGLLWSWATEEPLTASSGSKWPATGQNIRNAGLPLFPGYDVTGQRRDWRKTISEHAYHDRIRQAASILDKERSEATEGHCFDEFDLSRLGTHSLKKTAVTLMVEAEVSWAIISSITGTSIPMLQARCDTPTLDRQRVAMQSSFKHILKQGIAGQDQGIARAQASQPQRFCGQCGSKRSHQEDKFCANCGARYHDV